MKLDAMEANMTYVKRRFAEEDLGELREIKTAYKDFLLKKMNPDSSLLEVTDGVRVFERMVVTLSMC